MMTAVIDPQMAGQLVINARDGDRKAAERLVREHERWIRGVIYGVSGRPDLIDDIAQQVWTQAWQRLDSLRDPNRLRPWLYNIARNAAIDACVARKKRSSSASLDAENTAEPSADERSASPVGRVIADETQRRLMDAVQGLPAIYREPFVLRHLEDWTYARIGEVLGLSLETVETRLVRARRMLRETLKGKVTQ
jgi:RNA polymerase sigma-70 factor (ECF subfamily)